MARHSPPAGILGLLPQTTTRRGRVLRLLREVRGWSQVAVERELGMTRADLSSIETAKRRAGAKMIRRLLRHYQARPVELVLIMILLGYRPAPERFLREISQKYEFSD